MQGLSGGTDIAVTLPRRFEGLCWCGTGARLKEQTEPDGHGHVGISGPDVGDPSREAYLWGRAPLLLDRVSLGDLPSTASETNI